MCGCCYQKCLTSENCHPTLACAWQGHFYNTTDRGGGLFCPPPTQNSGNTGRINKIQTEFDRPGKFVVGNLMLLTSGSLVTLQVRSKSKCLTIWSIWFCRALEPYEMEISRYIDMDRVCDTSKYHPKLSVSVFKVPVSFKVTRSKKGQTENCGFRRRDAFFGSVFRQEREKWP